MNMYRASRRKRISANVIRLTNTGLLIVTITLMLLMLGALKFFVFG